MIYAILTNEYVGFVTVTVPPDVFALIENEFVALVIRMSPEKVSPFDVDVPPVLYKTKPSVPPTIDFVCCNTFVAPADQFVNATPTVIK